MKDNIVYYECRCGTVLGLRPERPIPSTCPTCNQAISTAQESKP
jgi:hypothetical protein